MLSLSQVRGSAGRAEADGPQLGVPRQTDQEARRRTGKGSRKKNCSLKKMMAVLLRPYPLSKFNQLKIIAYISFGNK